MSDFEQLVHGMNERLIIVMDGHTVGGHTIPPGGILYATTDGCGTWNDATGCPIIGNIKCAASVLMCTPIVARTIASAGFNTAPVSPEDVVQHTYTTPPEDDVAQELSDGS